MSSEPEPGIFDLALPKTPANYRPLTPIDFLLWSEAVFPNRTGVIYGERHWTWGEVGARCRRLASALARLGVGRGDTVAVMAPNTPALLEAHYGVPMAGAVLNALNTRLDAAALAFILEHGEAEVLLTDPEHAPVIKTALAQVRHPITVIDLVDPTVPAGERLGRMDYEEFLATGDPAFEPLFPEDEWNAISLCYTSGTTGDPKGVVYHHRGAYLNAMSSAMQFGLSSRSVYLWTLPMFHCNGWTFTWGVTAVGGTHVCLRKVDPAVIFELIDRVGVTHMCGAPIVLTMLIHSPPEVRRRPAQPIRILTGGASPPSTVIAAMEAMGFDILHGYGLTETYGPSVICVEQPGWPNLPLDERAALMARQGVRTPTIGGLAVADPLTLRPCPADGAAMGEIMLRGHTVMKGYLKNPRATEEAFRGGWFHTGDLAVMHPDNYVEVKDRSKDIIISGGENISSLEVEEALYKHPAVMEAAVVAAPDPKWGETPCAFIALKPDAGPVEAAEITAWCRQHLAGYKAPRRVVFGPLPKTSTGKIQKHVLRERAKREG